MAETMHSHMTRNCKECGTPFELNRRYSAAQRGRALYCSPRCSGKASAPVRTDMLVLLGGVRRFGKLTFIREGASTRTTRRGIFRCDCGNEKPMAIHHIKHGRTVSCGCEGGKRAASRFTKHGGYQTPEYKSWNAMMQRCYNPNSTSFQDYGARGIVVCPDWQGPQGFHRFVAYMGARPLGQTLDRIDSNGNYEPGNVRWATAKVQMNNRRVSRVIAYGGLAMNATDWARHLGMGKNTVDERLRKGWTVERALSEPVHRCGGNVKRKVS